MESQTPELLTKYNTLLDAALRGVEDTLASIAAAHDITPAAVDPASVCVCPHALSRALCFHRLCSHLWDSVWVPRRQ